MEERVAVSLQEARPLISSRWNSFGYFLNYFPATPCVILFPIRE